MLTTCMQCIHLPTFIYIYVCVYVNPATRLLWNQTLIYQPKTTAIDDDDDDDDVSDDDDDDGPIGFFVFFIMSMCLNGAN